MHWKPQKQSCDFTSSNQLQSGSRPTRGSKKRRAKVIILIHSDRRPDRTGCPCLNRKLLPNRGQAHVDRWEDVPINLSGCPILKNLLSYWKNLSEIRQNEKPTVSTLCGNIFSVVCLKGGKKKNTLASLCKNIRYSTYWSDFITSHYRGFLISSCVKISSEAREIEKTGSHCHFMACNCHG